MATDKRLTQLMRALKLIDLLARPQGATIEEMAGVLRVSTRSVRRYLDLIEELGFPLYNEPEATGPAKRWRLLGDYVQKLPNMAMPALKFTLQEIVALYLLKNESRLLTGTDFEKHVNSAFEKVSFFIPKDVITKLDKIKTLVVNSKKWAKDYSGKEKIIRGLTDAVFVQKTCLITYHSFGDNRIKSFKIDPLHFFENEGGLYLFARATSFGDILTLAVERIQKLDTTEYTFTYPEDFDPEECRAAAFNIVSDDPIELKIWFSEGQARYVRERRWAEHQAMTDLDDGSIILEMKTSGWWEVRRWLLSFGPEAELLEPEDLRQDIVGMVRRMGDIYKGVNNR